MKKVALVTGGTKGIGKGITLNLLKKGYKVVATFASDYTNADAMMQLLDIEEGMLLIRRCNLSVIDDLYDLIDYVKGITDHLDCLVCNAGSTIRKDFQMVSDEDWQEVMQVTVNSNFTLVREFKSIIPNASRLIFIGSMMGVYPHASNVVYGVSKAAVHALALNLVKEFEYTDTTINVIVPGFVETEWQKDKPQHIRESIYSKTAVSRFATVSEIVSAFDFCLNNGFVNGALLEVSGGYNYK
ncbi:SDR family NAD(P)-dependent oxidoreductase [Sphingobacterium composti]|uniref:SDR family NAD(P)-dependent oxidoreductase n=1 Tax=Sphingobacterium composti TaxID=363260 RepID=UPI00135B19DD|nr:SDR family oxidoreductase [Sphingobacterium composti Ten et al. 2007 non Yoo et al. 2007]